MNSPSSCLVCHSSDSKVLPAIHHSGILGYGLEIVINELGTSAPGCQWCALLSNSIKAFRGLSPNFKTNYPGRDPDRLFIQKPRAGRSLLVALNASQGTYVDHVEIYTQTDCLSAHIGCAADVPERLTLALATKKIQHWVSSCQQHPECGSSENEHPEMPTRVLFLEKHKVSLQENAGKRGIYATLSHCWGTSQVLKTTKETLKQRMSCIGWNSLPQIFQDAISLARSLGIKYLWIDSLCIIQEDSTDWLRESSRMVDIYSNSYLNFAATSSSGSHGSLFTKRWTTSVAYEVDPETLPRRPMKSYPILFQSDESIVKARYSTRSAHENITLFHNSRHLKRSDVFQKGPLLTRSWVFQERLLSPRTIHFHASEMIWECKTNLNCECRALEEAEPGLHDGILTVGKRWFYEMEEGLDSEIYTLENRWLDGVELYSRLRITKCTDKLPALSGLADRFAIQLQSDYLAGLWQCDLPRSLCWKVVGEQEDGPETDTQMKYGKRCHPYCAPTWSWASIDLSGTGIVASFEGRTAFEHLIMTDFTDDERYELIGAECITNADSPFGQVTSGALMIRAAVLPTILFYDDQYADPVCRLIFSNEHYRVDIDIDVENLRSRESRRKFKRCREPREMDVLVVLLGQTLPSEETATNWALVLMLTQSSMERYERIGIVEFPGSEPDFLDAEIRTIEIV